MKKYLIPALLALALGLGACAGQLPGIGFSVTNPVTSVDIYRAKNVYAATLDLAVKWRRYCWGRSYAVLMADPIAKPVCQNRRATLRKIQSADNVANSALTQADAFIRANPTITTSSVISAAWAAVTAFQQTVPTVNQVN